MLRYKVLTPNEFRSLEELEERIGRFQACYEEIAKPSEWEFTRCDLNRLPTKIGKPLAALSRFAA
jgi:hypothetical protein